MNLKRGLVVLIVVLVVIQDNVMARTVSGKTAYEPQHEKTNNVVSDQVWHKPGCIATGDGQKLEILDLASRGIVPSK